MTTREGYMLTSLPDTLQRVLPRTITGPVNPQNKGAIHWGWQGYVAYGCQCAVVVVDPSTIQCIQTLNGHTSHVTKVVWRNTNHYHQLSATYSLQLASGDGAGQIRVWDVATSQCNVLGAPQGNKQVSELCWLSGSYEGREHMLLALYPPHRLVLWDARHQTRLWTKTYPHFLSSLALDPFNGNKMAFLSEGCVLFADDLHPSRCPASNGTKFFIAASGGSGASGSPATASPTQSFGSGANTLRRRMRALVGGDNKTRAEESVTSSPCMQLTFHPNTPDRLLLLYPRELLVIDLAINVTVGLLSLDRPASPFSQVVPCWREDAVYCTHESGLVTVHERKLQPASPASFASDGCSELVYEKRCQSESLRLPKNNSCMGISVEPIYQTSLAMFLGDGRVLFMELSVALNNNVRRANSINARKLESSEEGVICSAFDYCCMLQKLCLDDVSRNDINKPSVTDDVATESPADAISPGVQVLTSNECNSNGKNTEDQTRSLSYVNVAEGFIEGYNRESSGDEKNVLLRMPDLSLTHLLQAAKTSKLRMVMAGTVASLSNPPFVVRMCPPLTTRNLSTYTPRLAVGNNAGSLLLVNAATGAILREVNVHTCPVRGIEWTSMESVLSFAHQPLTSAHGQVRNELFHVDLAGGLSTELRSSAQQESPIIAVRVSYLKQYFLVARRSDPLELWCCSSLSLLRTLPSRFPLPSALEWSPTSHVRRRRRRSDSTTEGTEAPRLSVYEGSSCDTSSIRDTSLATSASEPQESVAAEQQTQNTLSSIHQDTLHLLNDRHSEDIAVDNNTCGDVSNATVACLDSANADDKNDKNISAPFYETSTLLMGLSCEESLHDGAMRRTMTSSATFPSASVMKSAVSADVSTSMLASATSVQDFNCLERVVKETFMLSDAEGALYHLSVEGNVIKDGVKVPADPSMQRITSIACKSHLMVLADSESNLCLWDLTSRASGLVNAGRGPVRKIRFAPGRDNLKLLVLYGDGVADVWDMKQVTRIGRVTGEGGMRVLDGDWAASDRPLLATADGALRVMDLSLQACQSPLLHYCTHEPVGCPQLVSGEASLNLRSLLTHQPWRPGHFSLRFSEEDGFTPVQLKVIRRWISSIPESLQHFLLHCDSILHRALVAAALFGDQSELRFWSVAAQYLVVSRDATETNNATEGISSSVEVISFTDQSTNSSVSMLDGSGSSSQNNSNISISSNDKDEFASVSVKFCAKRLGSTNVEAAPLPLGASFDLFRDNASYRTSQLERLSLYSTKLLTTEQKASLCRQMTLLGERDKAVRLLLDEDPSSSGYYSSCLRACLVSASQHSVQSSSTMKLVATNLIAAGQVEEGVELLCLVQKGGEACGYLQSYGRWYESVWLARCSPQLHLQHQQVLSKWAQHLLLHGDKDGCVLALLSAGLVWEAVQQLAAQHYHQRAALLLQAAVQSGALPIALLPEHRNNNTDSDSKKVTPTMMALADNIHRKYALFLFGVSNKPAVAHLCKLLGESDDGIVGEA